MKAEMLLKHLQDLLGASKVCSDLKTLEAHSHDYWLLDLQRRLHGKSRSLPVCVVKAETESDISSVLAFASKESLPVVPYGAGSGVCAGARPDAGAIVLDLRSMNQLLSVNDDALHFTVQPGMIGAELEAALNKLGYSMGHFPQSIALSSVGGWAATRASGQYSSKYGSIENMLVSMKVVLADGTVIRTKNAPRAAAGPNVNELFLGSEGSLGVICELTYKMHLLPEAESKCAFQFPSMSAGLEAVRRIMRAGYKPALCRLYDPYDAERHFPGIVEKGTAMLLVLCEGPAGVAAAELQGISNLAQAWQGKSLGAKPVDTWKGRRFHIPNLQVLAEEKGVVFDTIEVAANWDKLPRLYESVIASLKQVPGLYVAYAHSSHSYQQGSCLYFSFAVKKENWLGRQLLQKVSGKRLGRFVKPSEITGIEAAYHTCWQKVMEATLACGGTIAHHHGIGKLRMPWVEDELGSSYEVLKRVKAALDPRGILNPGTLFPSSLKGSNRTVGAMPCVARTTNRGGAI